MNTEAILYIGLSQTLFAAFALATRSRVDLASRILIACLLTVAIKFLFFLLHTQLPEIFDISFSHGLTPFTFGPFLYLYTKYLISGQTTFKWKHLWHFIPFVLVTFFYFAFFKDIDFSEDRYLHFDKYLGVRLTFALLLFSSILVYTVLIFVQLKDFRKKISNQFSYMSTKLQLMWLNFVALLFSGTFMVYIITGAINAISQQNLIDVHSIAHFGLTVLAFAISYFGLRQPSLFRRVYEFQDRFPNEDEEEIVLIEKGDAGEKKKRFTREEALKLGERIDRYMLDEKPYLDPELTLADLSSQLNLSKYELTELLNDHLGKNFFSFVNEYRLKAVVRRLENPDYDHLTIIGIAYDCGFNSKSTFNSLFKQFAGVTPSEFKKNRT